MEARSSQAGDLYLEIWTSLVNSLTEGIEWCVALCSEALADAHISSRGFSLPQDLSRSCEIASTLRAHQPGAYS